MNYRQLQKALKVFKQKGLTDIALNSKKVVLQAELDRLRRTFGERIESMLAVSESKEKSERQSIQVTNEPIFPKKRKGLIHSTIHLLQCSCIMASRIVVPRPRIPVIHIPRSYQPA